VQNNIERTKVNLPGGTRINVISPQQKNDVEFEVTAHFGCLGFPPVLVCVVLREGQ